MIFNAQSTFPVVSGKRQLIHLITSQSFLTVPDISQSCLGMFWRKYSRINQKAKMCRIEALAVGKACYARLFWGGDHVSETLSTVHDKFHCCVHFCINFGDLDLISGRSGLAFQGGQVKPLLRLFLSTVKSDPVKLVYSCHIHGHDHAQNAFGKFPGKTLTLAFSRILKDLSNFA